jgi:hypothetical protein
VRRHIPAGGPDDEQRVRCPRCGHWPWQGSHGDDGCMAGWVTSGRACGCTYAVRRPQRYRVASWLVAVGALLVIAAVVTLLVIALGAVAGRASGPMVTPNRIPVPCPQGGPPPCLR